MKNKLAAPPYVRRAGEGRPTAGDRTVRLARYGSCHLVTVGGGPGPAGEEQELSQGNAVILYGLFLEGASWSQRESGRLVDPPARTQLSDFPRLLLSVFREVSTSDPSADPSSHAGIRDTHGVIYMCPCYTGLRRSRESLLFMVPIYTEEPAMVARWTLRKVALVANKF
ncbi:hypothetical protein GUITHDRAFT_143412 [Guillardia theta CCMP2712]|uniref:Dynein heavy chain C-terminal domain-containing protein n=1 Tax=Guillardia theta (strain CCMP2712) TaxID=905079 RepID=L1IU41_GUITC|nr:hypothetical protein GUITHDRAFT_143412 [Guillardia theta CCMP2712]EKX39409.1 hypothetical protein GUITHDRAFT_143412 [Guillardia theta CCMP2712]|eukprot:XP_005826389.1 hypothetical protein GUITHDRAFT_143412 [Guillardia theta CCMP2712]